MSYQPFPRHSSQNSNLRLGDDDDDGCEVFKANFIESKWKLRDEEERENEEEHIEGRGGAWGGARKKRIKNVAEGFNSLHVFKFGP